MTDADSRTPRFRVYIAQSLDGFIASPDGSIDWLDPFPGATFGFDDFIGGVRTIVMGRASYDQVRSFGSWPYAGTRTYVLTSRPFSPDRDDIACWTAGMPLLVEEIERSEEGDVWVMGGASTIGALLDFGRVDQVEVFVLPLLIGSGVPLHAAHEPRPLRLIEAAPLAHGVVKLTYATI
jgi:dihydrofolate reductase